MRIIYHAYDSDLQRGGQRDTYRHVDALKAAGVNAAVLHMTDGYRVKWFENDTEVIYMKKFLDTYNSRTDIVVLPEGLAAFAQQLPGKKVIFNKSTFYGWHTAGYPSSPRDPYLDSTVIAIFGVSDHNCAQLSFTYPEKDVYRVYAGVRDDLFKFTRLSKKRAQILYMAKSELQMRSVYNMLRSRGHQGLNLANRFKWISLNSMSEEAAAQAMRESFMFVFTNIEEGLPQVILEANMCGTPVLTYRSPPLTEAIISEQAIAVNDQVGFCKRIEEVMCQFGKDAPELKRWIEAAKLQTSHYTVANQFANVISVWTKILSKLQID